MTTLDTTKQLLNEMWEWPMMVFWRFKKTSPGPWFFGYRTHVHGSRGLVRMGLYNGDTTHGPVVDPAEIETRSYQ